MSDTNSDKLAYVILFLGLLFAGLFLYKILMEQRERRIERWVRISCQDSPSKGSCEVETERLERQTESLW
jgi:hypothetical protein